MKYTLLSIITVFLASCSSTKLEKANLSYKVFPSTASYKYEYNLAITPTIDNRSSKFIFNNDNYFNANILKSFNLLLTKELQSSSSFATIAQVNQNVDFNPSTTQIQELKRSLGKDAALITQINNFNVNIRKLTDQDTSNFVVLKVFTNITYKVALADSETILFLTTQDTSAEKVVPNDDNMYKHINSLSINSIKKNIDQAKKQLAVTTKRIIK